MSKLITKEELLELGFTRVDKLRYKLRYKNEHGYLLLFNNTCNSIAVYLDENEILIAVLLLRLDEGGYSIASKEVTATKDNVVKLIMVAKLIGELE